MAGGTSQKESQEEGRVNHKKLTQELQSEFDSVNLELREARRLYLKLQEANRVNLELLVAKLVRERTQQEFKGYEVELATNESSIQMLEWEILVLQDEISAFGSDLELLKSEEEALRYDFVRKLIDVKAKIRKFQQLVASGTYEAIISNPLLKAVDLVHAKTRDPEEAIRDLEDKLAQLISETKKEDQELQSEQNLYMQTQNEVDDLEHRISLIEAVMKESRELLELAIQASRPQEVCAAALGNNAE